MYTIFCFLQSGLYLKTILEQDVFLGKFTLIYVWKTVVKKLQASYRNYIVVYQLSPIHRTTLSLSLFFFISFLLSFLSFIPSLLPSCRCGLMDSNFKELKSFNIVFNSPLWVPPSWPLCTYHFTEEPWFLLMDNGIFRN